MQLALSSCFSITNDVVMSISLMYEQPESKSESLISFVIQILTLHSILSRKDLMARKPRNVRTDRLTDWRFFIQIYLVIFFFISVSWIGLNTLSSRTVHWPDDVALRNEHVVLLHV